MVKVRLGQNALRCCSLPFFRPPSCIALCTQVCAATLGVPVACTVAQSQHAVSHCVPCAVTDAPTQIYGCKMADVEFSAGAIEKNKLTSDEGPHMTEFSVNPATGIAQMRTVRDMPAQLVRWPTDMAGA